MKYKLINEPNPHFSATQQILYNRGIAEQDILHYMSLSDNDINSWETLGKDNLRLGWSLILRAMNFNTKAVIIVDCDCDGYTSAALLINYLYNFSPTWVKNNLLWYMHDGKQHGLSDCMDQILNIPHLSLVICPDSASNDYEQHKILNQHGIRTLVLDHHLADKISEDAVIINNQLSDYPNKELSGVGVVWQFCRFFDEELDEEEKCANDFLDLVALGLKHLG